MFRIISKLLVLISKALHGLTYHNSHLSTLAHLPIDCGPLGLNSRSSNNQLAPSSGSSVTWDLALPSPIFPGLVPSCLSVVSLDSSSSGRLALTWSLNSPIPLFLSSGHFHVVLVRISIAMTKYLIRTI
jgi:hypothetical protein